MAECAVCGFGPVEAPLCGRCVDRTRAALASVAEALEVTAPASGVAARPLTHEPRSAAKDRPLPGGTEALSFRQGADLEPVRLWADHAAEWLGSAPPRGGIVAAADYLSDVLADLNSRQYPAMVEMGHEVTRIGYAARALIAARSGRVRRVSAVGCKAVTEAGAPCGALIPLDSDMVTCRGCGAEWATIGLLRAHAPDGAWLKPVDAAAALGVSVRTLRRWYESGRVNRKDGCYDVLHVLGQR